MALEKSLTKDFFTIFSNKVSRHKPRQAMPLKFRKRGKCTNPHWWRHLQPRKNPDGINPDKTASIVMAEMVLVAITQIYGVERSLRMYFYHSLDQIPQLILHQECLWHQVLGQLNLCQQEVLLLHHFEMWQFAIGDYWHGQLLHRCSRHWSVVFRKLLKIESSDRLHFKACDIKKNFSLFDLRAMN